VARDGIEPPTPAFSGPRSTTELSGLGESKDAASAYVVSESAASGGEPGQVSNCAQATNVSITIASLCANLPPENLGEATGSERAMSYTGRSPRFPVELVALANLMRLSLMKAAHAAMDGTGNQGRNSNTPVAFAPYVPTPCSNLPGPPCRRLHGAALSGAVRHRPIASRSAKWRGPSL
jgi:hypothetical protein